jgi:hypothetical protein
MLPKEFVVRSVKIFLDLKERFTYCFQVISMSQKFKDVTTTGLDLDLSLLNEEIPKIKKNVRY